MTFPFSELTAFTGYPSKAHRNRLTGCAAPARAAALAVRAHRARQTLP